jgi:hypothetical protein
MFQQVCGVFYLLALATPSLEVGSHPLPVFLIGGGDVADEVAMQVLVDVVALVWLPGEEHMLVNISLRADSA